MIGHLTDGVPRRALFLLAGVLAALLIAPWLVNDYLLTVLIVILYFSYAGQAWNVMTGFTGHLSLGHALYVGLGAYAAAALFVHFGIGPWIGIFTAILVAMIVGVEGKHRFIREKLCAVLVNQRVRDPCLNRVRAQP